MGHLPPQSFSNLYVFFFYWNVLLFLIGAELLLSILVLIFFLFTIDRAAKRWESSFPLVKTEPLKKHDDKSRSVL